MVAPGVFLDTLNILVTAPLDDCSNIKKSFWGAIHPDAAAAGGATIHPRSNLQVFA
jgi:hypothetical protein